MEHKIKRSSFDKLDSDPSIKFNEKVSNWLRKLSDIITDEWKELIRPDNYNAGKMYGMVKIQKANNLVCAVTSVCKTVVEKARSECRQKLTKQEKMSDLKLITSYKPALPNIHNIIIKKLFPSKSIKILFRIEKHLKEN